MADYEEERPKSTEEQDAEPRAPRHEFLPAELPEDGGDPKPAEKMVEAETPPPLEEPSEFTPPELEAHEEHQSPADTPPQPSESQAPAAELPSPVPPAPPPQPAAPEPVKPRSLFPALAATALVGALLGLAGSYGLRFLEASRINPPPFDDRLTEFKARLDAIESKGEAASSSSRAALSALEARVATAEAAAQNAAESAKAAESDVQKAAASLPAVQAPSDGSPARAEPPDLGPIESRLAALEQKLAQNGSESAALKTNLRAEPQPENASASEAARAQEIAIVAENLLRKLDHGEEFSADLTALENLGLPEPALAPLRAASLSPVATERELTVQFANLSGKIIAAESAAPAGQEESFLDRVTRNAKSLVDIRRVGDSSAADVQSLVTRIESALADHEIEAAYKAWTDLPGAAKSVAQSWGQAAKLRLDAVNAAKSFEADAVAVLGKPKPKAEIRN
jgi:hypothetical protein